MTIVASPAVVIELNIWLKTGVIGLKTRTTRTETVPPTAVWPVELQVCVVQLPVGGGAPAASQLV
jgi:hypothetical protein